jgi:hypothetical protein
MKSNPMSTQPSRKHDPKLSLIEPLSTTVSVEKTFHNSTWAPDLNNRFSMENTGRPTRITFSSNTTKPNSRCQPKPGSITMAIRRQKLNRRKTQLATLISRSRSRDLPMTRAVTVNWERILQYPTECSIAQSQMFRRLKNIARKLGFETAYVWVLDNGVEVGLHTHFALNWPFRHLSYLHNLFHEIDPNCEQPPNNIHDMEIIYHQNGDYKWGQYMAEQVNKHSYDVKGRMLGYSSNLSIVLK